MASKLPSPRGHTHGARISRDCWAAIARAVRDAPTANAK